MNLPNCKKPCSNCPFRKDSLKGWLGEQRITEILKADSFTCHKTTDSKQLLQCAGHMITKGNDNQFVSTANSLKIDLKLSGKELLFQSEKQLINHHKN